MPADVEAVEPPPRPRAAGLWLRLLAGLVDLAIQAALAAGATWAWFARRPPDLPPRYWNQLDYLVDLVNTRPDLFLPPLAAFVAVHVAWQTAFCATLGNAPVARALGMRVVDGRGRAIGPVRAFLRTVLGVPLAAAAFAGPLWALVSPRRRMLHDILCGCHVLRGGVPAPDAPEDAPPAGDGEPAWEAGPRR